MKSVLMYHFVDVQLACFGLIATKYASVIWAMVTSTMAITVPLIILYVEFITINFLADWFMVLFDVGGSFMASIYITFIVSLDFNLHFRF